MNDESLFDYIQYFFSIYGVDILRGTLTTLWIVPTSLLIGLSIAIPMGILLSSRKPWLVRAPVMLFSYIFRGTPMLVQLYLIYYALGIWLSEVQVFSVYINGLLRNKEFWGILCLSLNTAAYTSEIVRGAISTAPIGEIEAARAFGMTKWQIQRRIIFPGAIRRGLMAYSNEVVFMLHGSTIISTIAIGDLTQAARNAYGRLYEPYLPFITAGMIYLIITMIILSLFRFWERRLYRHISS